MNKLRMAVIGAGRLGGFHAQKIAQHNDIELVAVVDPMAANRDRVAAENHTEARSEYHGLLRQLDAVVVAAPTRLHHCIALELLEAGVHVLVEKPICTTRAEADALVSAARRRHVVLQVGHIERFNPAFQAVAPHLADPKYIEAVRTSNFTFRSTDVGVVLDVMIHDIDLVLSLASGRICKVDATGLSILGGHEDVANVRLEFDSGCVATLSASRVSDEQVRRMQVWATRASANIDLANRTATIVRPSETLLRRQIDFNALTPEQVAYYRDHFAEELLPREQLRLAAVDALAFELDDFVVSIRAKRPPRVTGEAGRNALAVAERILDRIHARTGDAIEGFPDPTAIPSRQIIPAPHFDLAAAKHPPSPLAKAG